MGTTAVEKKWTDRDRALVRNFSRFMQAEGWDLKAAAQRLRKSTSTISLMVHERYAGDVAGIARGMLRLMQRQRARKSAPPPPRFQRTYVAEQILGVLHLAHEDRDMHLVLGAPGVGKTRSAQEYCRAEEDVLCIVVRPRCSAGSILKKLGQLCGVPWAGSCHTTADALVAVLKDSDRLLVLDDVDWLAAHDDTLTYVRLICEEARIGCVLLGTPFFLESLNRRSSGPVAQFLDRLLVWSLGEAPASDLREVARGCGIEVNEAAMTALLAGARGSVRRGIRALRAAARRSKDGAVKVADVEAAVAQLSGR